MARAEKYLYTRNNWLQSRLRYLEPAEANGRVKFVRRAFTLVRDGDDVEAWAKRELADLEGAEADAFADELARFCDALSDA